MKCPKCFKTDVSSVGNTHYICNNPNCTDNNGHRTQFKIVTDTKKYFPYDQIFSNHSILDFYRNEYLVSRQ